MSMMPRFDDFEQMLEVLLENIRPPERLSVAQAAAKYRYLKEATHIGLWDNSIAPYLVEPMNEMESLEFNAVAFAGPARCGKSDMFFNWLGYAAIADPGDMMVVHMTQSTARDWSQADLRKALRHSTAIGKKVLPGKQSMNTHDIQFTAMRLLVKWPTITELSGKTLRRCWLMDMDRMPIDIDKEGTPFALTRKRTTTYGRHGMTVAESSPGFEVNNHRWIASTPHEAPPTEGILAVYNQGDRRRWYWRCHDCSHPFEGDFKHLNWPPPEKVPDLYAASEMVTLDCPKCGHSHTHDPGDGQPGKVGLNANGMWIKDGMELHPDGSVTGKPFRSDIASFWLKGVAAAFIDWPNLVRKYVNAMDDYTRTGDTGSLKACWNTDLGHPFTPPALTGERSPEDIMGKSIDWEAGTIPYGVRYLTASIDVQRSRFVVQVHGHGAGNDTYVIDRFDIKKSDRVDEDGDQLWVSPHGEETDWHLLIPQVIERVYPLEGDDNRFMKIKAVVCDSGGKEGVTTNAYAFWRYLRDEHPGGHHRRFQLLKGASSPHAPQTLVTYPDAERKDRHALSRGEVPVMMINTNIIKDKVDGLLDRTKEFGGKIIFPSWLPTSFFTELTVEVRNPKGAWENPKKLRNESWDLLVYDYALGHNARHIGVDHINWETPPKWAEEWEDNILVFTKAEDTPFEPVSEVRKRVSLADLAKELA